MSLAMRIRSAGLVGWAEVKAVLREVLRNYRKLPSRVCGAKAKLAMGEETG
jgi:hypothetical protein